MGAHKFLGSQIFFSGKTNEVFDYVKTEISSKMKNIDQSLVRPEYKVSIYVRYLLPALRFMMSVHTMHKSHLDVLDTMTDGYLKKWLGIPSRGANIAVVHLPQGMGIPRFSDVYWKANCSAYSRSRLVGDELVKHALDSTLERESKWTTKQSTVTVCHDVHEKVVEERGANVGSWATWKKKISNIIEDNAIVYWKEKIEPLLCQGKFAELLITENENLTWKSIMFNLPRKVLKFAINACIDSLPSYANLSRWGKRLSDKCPLCPNVTGTLHHILSNCPSLLERYTWRHNNVLKVIHTAISTGNGNLRVYCDLEGQMIAGGTIPPDILVTNQRPDIVIKWDDPKELLLIELTVPFECNIQDAHKRKIDRYESLVQDLNETDYDVTYVAIEVGQRGLINKENKIRLKHILDACECNKSPKEVIADMSKAAVLASFVIFYSRHEQSWTDAPYMSI